MRVFEEAEGVSCPLCAVPLAHATLAGVRLLYCARCHGMLLPMDILGGLISELRAQTGAHRTVLAPPDPGELNRHVACPKCGQGMDTHRYGGPGNLVIDSCEPCQSVWLDHGELMRAVRTPEHALPPE